MHLEPSDASARRLFERGIEGPVTMLNLLRFREQADYAEFPQLAPPSPICGRDAYDRYVRHTIPFLMLITQSSVADFFGFASNADYMAGVGHRTAALEDSRLLPVARAALP
jgi:hypothetical protein